MVFRTLVLLVALFLTPVSLFASTLEITFSKAVSVGSGGSGGMAMSASAGAVTLTYVSGSGSAVLLYSTSRTIKAGETVSLSYTQPGNGLENTDDGVDIPTFSGSSVTNQSTSQYTITSTNGPNGTISPIGATGVNYGGSQAYTITPASHYHVSDVSIDGVSQGALTSYTFTSVNADHTIAATFAIDTYNIVSSTGANGTISPLGTTAVNYNGSQAYTMTPSAHYKVASVLVDGINQGSITSYTFSNVVAAHTISVTFSQITWTITASAGANGSISPSGGVSVVDGNNQSFTITANTGYHIADILVDGVSVGTTSPYQFTNVTAAHTIVASFAVSPPTITSSAGANGTITPLGASEIELGGSKTYVVIPNRGYCVADMLVDSTSVGKKGYYQFTNVLTDHTISSTFEACPNNLGTIYQR